MLLYFSPKLYIMKLNRNYCLMGILILVLLYCCLGSNLLEGLSNNSDKSVAEQVQSEGAKHASDEYKQYQEELGDEGLPQDKDFHNSNASSKKSSSLGQSFMPSFMASFNKAGLSSCITECTKTAGSSKANECSSECNNIFNNKQKNTNLPTECSVSEKWSADKKKCEPLKASSYNENDGCDTGYVWNSVSSKCIPSNNGSSISNMKGIGSSISSDLSSGAKSLSSDLSSGAKSLSSDFSSLFSSNSSNKQVAQQSGQHVGTYPPNAPAISHSQIPPGQHDQYILKSQIVPPVCPACPPQLSCPSKAKCPPCPAPEPVQPCTPCARCPESPFTCKKVPDYTSPSVGSVLPRPMLNDFSQF